MAATSSAQSLPGYMNVETSLTEPEDVEQDPAATTYPIPDDRISRGIVSHQGYWKANGTWEPRAWRLKLVVRGGHEILGVQELEGNDCPSCARSTRRHSWSRRRAAAAMASKCGPWYSRWPSYPCKRGLP